MNEILSNKIVKTLIDITKQYHVASIRYQKATLDQNPHWRLIEAYSLTQGKQDYLLRAYQIDAEEGWRFFMLHKIIEIRDHGSVFTPRRKITIIDGIVSNVYEPYEAWDKHVQKYRDLVLNALADRYLSVYERKQIIEFQNKYNLSIQQIRSVHASIFLNCLTHLLSDGLVNDEEEKEINLVNQYLKDCGCAIIK